MLANWHMPISVVPGKADARHCNIKARGASASQVRMPVVGQPLSCILSTADAHGNVRHSGGAEVSPVVIRPDGEETSKAKVLLHPPLQTCSSCHPCVQWYFVLVKKCRVGP
jgi:hypothetical protein